MPMSTQRPPMQSGGKSGIGAVVAIVVIIAIVAVGGAYYYMTMVQANQKAADALPTSDTIKNSDDPQVQATLKQSQSDSVADISADAQATDFSGIDNSMSNLDSASAGQ